VFGAIPSVFLFFTFFLLFQLLHIQIFPLTVADTFVTLSWNTSRSLARDFVLHVLQESAADAAGDLNAAPLEYSNIEVGLKMASYTISSLRPSTLYTVQLVMKKGEHSMVVSSMRLRTRPEHYLVDLGIEKDYTAMVAVGGLLLVAAASCLGLSAWRLYQLRCCCRLDLMAAAAGGEGDGDDDNLSTKQILSSGSEPSSIAGLSAGAVSRSGGKGCGGDKSRLVENEVASPTDDPPARPPPLTTAKVSRSASRPNGGGQRRSDGVSPR
jgi:hypothetical protein